MQIEKPKVQRVRVTALDPDTGKSKSTTIYETTPDHVISKLEEIAEQSQDERPEPAAS